MLAELEFKNSPGNEYNKQYDILASQWYHRRHYIIIISALLPKHKSENAKTTLRQSANTAIAKINFITVN